MCTVFIVMHSSKKIFEHVFIYLVWFNCFLFWVHTCKPSLNLCYFMCNSFVPCLHKIPFFAALSSSGSSISKHFVIFHPNLELSHYIKLLLLFIRQNEMKTSVTRKLQANEIHMKCHHIHPNANILWSDKWFTLYSLCFNISFYFFLYHVCAWHFCMNFSIINTI